MYPPSQVLGEAIYKLHTGNSTRTSSPRRRPSTARLCGYAHPSPAPSAHLHTHPHTPPTHASTPSTGHAQPCPARRALACPACRRGVGRGGSSAGWLVGGLGRAWAAGRAWEPRPIDAMRPRCGALVGVDQGRRGDAAAAALCADVFAFSVQGRRDCAPVVFGPGLGLLDLLMSRLYCVARRRPHPCPHMSMYM